jgi:hypothetical protein
MTESGGIQREPSALPPPSPPDVTVGPLQKCPHCGYTLGVNDVASGQCWFCEKRLTDPVKPKRPQTPFLATFLLGLLGAILGFVVGSVLLATKVVEGSWTVSICGGIGFATGSAIARALFSKQE